MKEAILMNINFRNLIDELRNIVFINSSDIYENIQNDLIILCDSNFTCYKANMEIIACRKEVDIDYKKIAYFENMARTVGEMRVNSKLNINKIIHKMFSKVKEYETETWMSDDIVYSIGEMLDRISIEYIKQNHYSTIHDGEVKTINSKIWQDRVKNYLTKKLDEIAKKGFYELNVESRTYKF